MPELPDVEKHRRTIAEHATGRVVRGVEVRDAGLLDGTSPQGLGRSLTGRVVGEPRRLGKWLSVGFDEDGPTLLFHFRMTGELTWDEEERAEDAVAFHLDGGVLSYRSRRRLGGVSYLRPGQDPTEVTGPLGPDALEVERPQLEQLLTGRRGGLKSALMDQHLIGGLGNELVDEILWRTGLHPRRRAAELTTAEVEELHRQLRDVLHRSVRAGHVPAGPRWLNGQRRDPEPRCPNCETPLEQARVGGRTTFWCPRHQPTSSG